MKNILLLTAIICSSKLYAQMDTCTYVNDTIFSWSTCSLGCGPCPKNDVLVHLYDNVEGLTTYITWNDPDNPNGSIYEVDLGNINFGDTIPVTANKFEFKFYDATCTSINADISIIIAGTPSVLEENYQCYSDITRSTAFIIDGCENFCLENILFGDTAQNCNTTECTNSIFEIENNKFIISPNPTSDYLNIKLSGMQHFMGSCMLYNIFGELMSIENVYNGTARFDVRDIKDGIYYLYIQNGDTLIRKKITKVNVL